MSWIRARSAPSAERATSGPPGHRRASGGSQLVNATLEQRVSWLKEWLRELEALLTRYEPVAVPTASRPPGQPPPPGRTETVSVYRNGEPAGEVVIAGGR